MGYFDEKKLLYFFITITCFVFPCHNKAPNLIGNFNFQVENYNKESNITYYKEVPPWICSPKNYFPISRWCDFLEKTIEDEYIFLFSSVRYYELEQKILLPRIGYYSFEIKYAINCIFEKTNELKLVVRFNQIINILSLKNKNRIEKASYDFFLNEQVLTISLSMFKEIKKEIFVGISEIILKYTKKSILRKDEIEYKNKTNQHIIIINGNFLHPFLTIEQKIEEFESNECLGWIETKKGYIVKANKFNENYSQGKQAILFSHFELSEFYQYFKVPFVGIFTIYILWSETCEHFSQGKLSIEINEETIYEFPISEITELQHFFFEYNFIKLTNKISFKSSLFLEKNSGFLIALVIVDQMNILRNGMFEKPEIKNHQKALDISFSEAKPWFIFDAFHERNHAFIGEGKLFSQLWKPKVIVFKMTYFAKNLILLQKLFLIVGKIYKFYLEYVCDLPELTETFLNIWMDNESSIQEKKFTINSFVTEKVETIEFIFEAKKKEVLLHIICSGLSHLKKGFTISNVRIYEFGLELFEYHYPPEEEQELTPTTPFEHKRLNAVKSKRLEERQQSLVREEREIENELKIKVDKKNEKNLIKNENFMYPKKETERILLLAFNEAYPWICEDDFGHASMFEVGPSSLFHRPLTSGNVAQMTSFKQNVVLMQAVNLKPNAQYKLKFKWYNNFFNEYNKLEVFINDFKIEIKPWKTYKAYKKESFIFTATTTLNMIRFKTFGSFPPFKGFTLGEIELFPEDKSEKKLSYPVQTYTPKLYSKEPSTYNYLKNGIFNPPHLEEKAEFFETIPYWYEKNKRKFLIEKLSDTEQENEREINFLVFTLNQLHNLRYMQRVEDLEPETFYMLDYIVHSSLEQEDVNSSLRLVFKIGETIIGCNSFSEGNITEIKSLLFKTPKNEEKVFSINCETNEHINNSEYSFVGISDIKIMKFSYPFNEFAMFLKNDIDFKAIVTKKYSNNIIRNGDFHLPKIPFEKSYRYFYFNEGVYWNVKGVGEVVRAKIYNSLFKSFEKALLISPMIEECKIEQTIKVNPTSLLNIFVLYFEWSETNNEFYEGEASIWINENKIFDFYRLRKLKNFVEKKKIFKKIIINTEKAEISIRSIGFNILESGYMLTNLKLEKYKSYHKFLIETTEKEIKKDNLYNMEIIKNSNFKTNFNFQKKNTISDQEIDYWNGLYHDKITLEAIEIVESKEKKMENFVVLETEIENGIEQNFVLKNKENKEYLALSICFLKEFLTKASFEIIIKSSKDEIKKEIRIFEHQRLECHRYFILLKSYKNQIKILNTVTESQETNEIKITKVCLRKITKKNKYFLGEEQFDLIKKQANENGFYLYNGDFNAPKLEFKSSLFEKDEIFFWKISTIANLVKANEFNDNFELNKQALLLSPSFEEIVVEQNFVVPSMSKYEYLELSFIYSSTKEPFIKGNAKICLGEECYELEKNYNEQTSIRSINICSKEIKIRSKVEIISKEFEIGNGGFLVTDFKLSIKSTV